MSATAILASNVGKEYHIGSHQKQYDRITDQVLDAISAPVRRFGKILRGQASGATGMDETIWALTDINFEIQHGETLGIIGRNGAGKSTLLKILSRITEPTTGRIEIFGRIGSLLEVGTGFHPELTGRENIFLNGAILGMKKSVIERRLDEIIDFAEIDKFIDTPVKQYSSGMYVRLAFSVAAHLEPEILIVDEVLAVGDASFQKKCLGKMGDVAQEGRTVLFVSHNMSLIQTLCQRGILLQHGRMLYDGPIQDAVDTYLRSLESLTTDVLSSRADRRGLGQSRVINVEILNKEGLPTTTLKSGQPARFEFEVDRILPNTRITFNIFDHMGQPVTQFNSHLSGPQDLTDPQNSNKYVCEFDQFMLLPQRYRLDIHLTADNRYQDGIQSARIFDVIEGLIDGRPVRSTRFFRVVFPHRWILPGKPNN
jgi:lipopolysaccharide transport system ATP-binding protein